MSSPAPPADAPACPSCGSGVDPHASFCTACGAALRTRRVPPPVVWAVLAALAVGAIAAVVMARGGDDGVGEGPVVVADPVEVIETTTVPGTPGVASTAGPTTTADPATSAPASSLPPTTPVTTAVPDTTVPVPPTSMTTVAPDTTASPGSAIDGGTPGFFSTPDDAIADHLSLVEPPYAGTCESLAGREVELGGVVTCSVLDQDLQPQQIHRWGVFATDDLRGWLFLDVGSAGWSVADETFELFPPEEWTFTVP